MSSYDSIIQQDLDGLTKALAEGADPNEVKYGDSLLSKVVEMEWPEGLEALLGAGGDLGRLSEGGDAPLMTSVIHKRPAMTAALLAAGADLEQSNKVGASPFLWAVAMHVGPPMVVTSYVIEDGVKKETTSTSLGDANRLKAVEITRMLLKAGANPNAVDGIGMTAAHFAAQKGDLEFLKVALEGGADLGHVNPVNGSGAVLLAARHGHPEMVRFLLEQGGDASASDNDGFSPLHEAAFEGHDEVVEALLAAGADRSAQITKGWDKIEAGMTPLDIAKLKEHSKIVALLG